jgi:hypothetical protein
LRATDTANCQQAFFNGPRPADAEQREGFLTAFISETAQVIGAVSEEAGYRTVTSRACGGRQDQELLFSISTALVKNDDKFEAVPLQESTEIIAFNEVDGVFNYYQTFPASDAIVFFGNSVDMLEASPLMGAEGPDPGPSPRRCAKCHRSGGLVMKELPAPWLHWEGDFRLPEGKAGDNGTPGITELLASHTEFGTRSNGIAVEGMVRQGNTQWNQTRFRVIRESGKPDAIKEMLRPLFCTVEVNLANGSSSFSPPDGLADRTPTFADLNRLPINAVLDSNLSFFTNLQIRAQDYDAVIKESNQRLMRGPKNNPNAGQQLRSPKRDAQGKLVPNEVAAAIDTVFDLVFVNRSGVDTEWVSLLQQKGVVDQEFVRDVLMIDFTRQIFSDDRCALLEFAPTLREIAPEFDNPADLLVRSPGDLARRIKDKYLAKLKASRPAPGTAGAALIANLENNKDQLIHKIQLGRFADACLKMVKRDPMDATKITDSKELVTEFYKWVSAARKKAMKMAVFEFLPTMPINGLAVNENTLRLDPNTCKAVNQFTLPAPVEIPATFEKCVPSGETRPADAPPIVCDKNRKALDKDCHPCVTEVCRQNSFCCKTTTPNPGNWSSFCARRAIELCGVECPDNDQPGGPIITPLPVPGPIIPFNPGITPAVLESSVPADPRLESIRSEERKRQGNRSGTPNP